MKSYPRSLSKTISTLLERIDDSKRASDIALIDYYKGPEMTYGYLSTESKRIAGILEKKLDPSVQSIGKK